jgi:uncharacterized protein
MLCVSPSPFLRDWLKGRSNWEERVAEVTSSSNVWVDNFSRSLLIGLFSGFQAGLFGVGGGAVVVPCLCYFTDLKYKESLGTSMAIMFPTALFASIQHFRQGSMVVHCAVPLAAGCLIGSFLGGGLVVNSSERNDAYLKGGFTALMVTLGSRTLLSALKYVK